MNLGMGRSVNFVHWWSGSGEVALTQIKLQQAARPGWRAIEAGKVIEQRIDTNSVSRQSATQILAGTLHPPGRSPAMRLIVGCACDITP
jgi:hypothetical protein